MTIPTPGDHVVARWQPGTRHGDVEAINSPVCVLDPIEISVRWDDGGWKAYPSYRFISEGFGTWELTR